MAIMDQIKAACGRFGNSIVVALCVSPLILVLSAWVLGYNERRAVCSQRAILQGKDEVVQVACDDARRGDGELVMFSCDLDRNSTPEFPLGGIGTSFEGVRHRGAGLVIVSELYQCVESVRTVSDGNGTSVDSYSYTKKWVPGYVSESSFNGAYRSDPGWTRNCGGRLNQPLPSEIPPSQTHRADSAKVGAFTVEASFLRSVRLDTAVKVGLREIDAGNGTWTRLGSGSTTWYVMGDESRVELARVAFFSNDWSSTRYTALGANRGGIIKNWVAEDTWLCSGFILGQMREGLVSAEQMFADMMAASAGLTWVLRVLGFLGMWVAFFCCFKPFEVAASCVPFIGRCLSNSIEKILIVISCPMACSCALGVAGVVWVVMRPMVGLPMLIIFVCGVAGFVAFKVYTDRQKQASGEDNGQVDPEQPSDETGNGENPEPEDGGNLAPENGGNPEPENAGDARDCPSSVHASAEETALEVPVETTVMAEV